MSIMTLRGDEGFTSLMYGRRVSKNDPRVACYGALDELNAALGLARASASEAPLGVTELCASVQTDLITVMGELATAEEDRERYREDGFEPTSFEMVDRLTAAGHELEDVRGIRFRGWATPGSSGSLCAAQLDFARTVCRRAERCAASLMEAGLLSNREVLRYLNRLSDVLWLLARWTGGEGLSEAESAPGVLDT
jgi:cob(I)alamin adenosyltransferase